MEEKLYQLILKRFKNIKEINYIDFDFGQINMEKPPISYPAVLINIDFPNAENINGKVQQVQALISFTLVTKAIAETNNIAPEDIRKNGLEFLRLRQKVYENFQGYGNDEFYPFERKKTQNNSLRQGLKTTLLVFDTSFHDYTANT